MNTFTWKSLWGRRGKLALSLTAIALAVTFVTGALSFTGHLQAQYTTLALGRLSDVVVAADGALDPERRDARQVAYTDADLALVRAVPGVARAEVHPTSHGVAFDNADGTPANAGVTPLTATAWSEFPSSTGAPAFAVVAGRAPAAGEFALDPATLRDSGHRVGDRIELHIAAGGTVATHSLTLVGSAEPGSGASTDRWLLLDAGQARSLLGHDARTQVWVALADDADPAVTTAAIERSLPGSRALDATEVAALQGSAQAEALGFLEPLLLVFAGIAVVVACFLIANTFTILVVQRTQELALLRALGASARQIRRTVVLEALATGIVGSLLGVLAGWALASGMVALTGGGASVPLGVDAALAGLAVGVGVTLLASLLPAQQASRVAPVAAMRGGSAGPGPRRPRRSRTGDGTPRFDRPLTRLAALNAARRPGRTIATAATLTVGLFLVGLLGVVGASMKASIAVMMPDAFGSDVLVMGSEPIPADRITDLAGTPGVASVHRWETAGASIDGEQTAVSGVLPGDHGTAIRQTIVTGRPAEAAGELTVTRSMAEQRGWTVGREVPGVLNGSEVTWRIVGVFEYPANIAMSDHLTVPATLRTTGLEEAVTMIAVRFAEGTETATVTQSVRDVVKRIPGAALLDLAEYNAVAGAQVDGLMTGVYALIGMSVAIAALGIVNTLGLSVVERTRELGLLRAVGATRGQVRGLVAREALLVSALGGGTGLGLGVLAGIAAQRAFTDTLPALGLPWAQLAVAAALVAIIGVLAALGPATRAARTDVLAAVTA